MGFSVNCISAIETGTEGKNKTVSMVQWKPNRLYHYSKLGRSKINEEMLKFHACWQGSSQSTYAQLYKHKHSSRVNWDLSISLEHLSSWLATIEKREQCLTACRERCRASSQSSSHGNQAGEQAFETQNKRMTKCNPCPLSFACSLLPPPLIRLRFMQGKKKKNGWRSRLSDLKDSLDDRWDGTGKDKTQEFKKCCHDTRWEKIK